jgi:hypothetical protein
MRDPGGQAALVHTPGTGGIWRRYRLDSGAINAAPWLDALSRGELVGTCRWCGGYLRPGPPYRLGLTDWYPARCTGRGDQPGCGREPAAHGPRPKIKHNPKGRS